MIPKNFHNIYASHTNVWTKSKDFDIGLFYDVHDYMIFFLGERDQNPLIIERDFLEEELNKILKGVEV